MGCSIQAGVPWAALCKQVALGGAQEARLEAEAALELLPCAVLLPRLLVQQHPGPTLSKVAPLKHYKLFKRMRPLGLPSQAAGWLPVLLGSHPTSSL
eukprot:1160046-Pelagomonas_calceolata.AAC.5